MGYEITYKYHERLEAGGYDKENVKELKRRVGEAYDDVPLEKLAAAIMQQLARRDIWVIDVELMEYTRKKITFKETKGGIVIKNKKFILDNDNTLVGQDLVSEEIAPSVPGQQVVHPHEQIRPQQSQAPARQQPSRAPTPPSRPQRVRRRVVYMPSTPELIMKHGLAGRLTVEKEYDVFEDRMNPSGVGVEYLIKDDRGRDCWAQDEHFVPSQTNLLGDRELGFSKSSRNSDNNNLKWDGVINSDVPSLR
jgi:hypothetical protein